MTTFVSRPRGSVGSSNERDTPNGRCGFNKDRTVSLSTDNLNITDKKGRNKLENTDAEYHPMVCLPSHSQKYEELSEPILNNNVHSVQNVNVDVG